MFLTDLNSKEINVYDKTLRRLRWQILSFYFSSFILKTHNFSEKL